MGKLSTALSGSVLAREHEKLLRSALRRKALRLGEKPKGTLRGVSAKTRADAVEVWRARMFHEHQSSAVFSRLLPQLIEAEAPLDAKTAVLKMAMDELHHAALCADVIRYLGGNPDAEGELATEPLPEHADGSPKERALRNVLFVGCLSETVALSLLTEEREAATDPYIRRVLSQLGADEVMHAKLGWAYVGLVWPQLSHEEKERTRRYLAVAVPHLRHLIFRRAPPEGSVSRAASAKLARLGLLRADRVRELVDATLREVILPRLAEIGMTPLGPAKGATR